MTDTTIDTSAVDRFCEAITCAGFERTDLFCDDAVLEAVVPNWRFVTRGAAAVRTELGHWFADPGCFVWLHRTPLPEGELVQFELVWEEHGVTHACRQVHVLRLRDGRIAEDAAWCGGRWPASLVAEISAAQLAADAAPEPAGR
jgi:hypothetical protein